MWRLVKYFLVFGAAAMVFAVTWGLQYLYWFPGEVAGAMFSQVANMGMDEFKKTAVPIDDSQSLSAALAGFRGEGAKYPFLAYFQDVINNDRVYVQVNTGWGEEKKSLTSVQARAFDLFKAIFPGRKRELMTTGLERYNASRDEMMEGFKQAEEEAKRKGQKGGGAAFGDFLLPAIASVEEMEQKGYETWIELWQEDDRGDVHVNIRFQPPKSLMGSVNVIMLGEKVIDPKEQYRLDNDDFDPYDDDEEYDERSSGFGSV